MIQEKKKYNQEQIVLMYLVSGKEITSRKAIMYFNIMRLASVISSLKKQGFKINTERRSNLHNNATYVVYSLDKLSMDNLEKLEFI